MGNSLQNSYLLVCASFFIFTPWLSETKVWKTSWKIIEDNKKKEVKNPIIQASLIF